MSRLFKLPDGRFKLPPHNMRILGSMGKKHVVLAGGTGNLGRSLKAALFARGHGITTISRTPHPKWPLKRDTLQWWEVTSNEVGLPACDAIIQVTGEPFLSNKAYTKEKEEELLNSRAGITKLLRKHTSFVEFKPLVYIQISSVNYYPHSETETYDETYSGNHANDIFGKIWHETEQEALKFKEEYNIRPVIIRLGNVLNYTGYIDLYRMDKDGRLGFWTTFGKGNQWLPWIHIEDACNLIINALENEDISGVVNGVAPELITQRKFGEELSDLVGMRFKLPAPEVLLQYKYAHSSPLLLEGRRVVSKVANDIDFKFKFPNVKDALYDLKNDIIKPKFYS